MKLTTTLNRLKSANACTSRYEHLVKALGGVSFDHDAPIDLLTILEHNGVNDCEWALRNCFPGSVTAPAWAEYKRVTASAWAEVLS